MMILKLRVRYAHGDYNPSKCMLANFAKVDASMLQSGSTQNRMLEWPCACSSMLLYHISMLPYHSSMANRLST